MVSNNNCRPKAVNSWPCNERVGLPQEQTECEQSQAAWAAGAGPGPGAGKQGSWQDEEGREPASKAGAGRAIIQQILLDKDRVQVPGDPWAEEDTVPL